ncbi:MAG: hypothetical protein ACAI44_39680 [Candidatus Sericytochromatia bacterium]
MSNIYTSEAAWQAFDNGDLERAGQIWLTLMHRPQALETHNRYQLNYAQVLIAQGRYLEAQRMLQELYTRTGHSRFLHLLGCLARQAGQLKKALRLFLTEKEHLDAEDHLALAINAYELGLTAWQRRDYTQAIEAAESSLSHAIKAQDLTCKGIAHRLLGDLLLAANRRGDARSCYLAAYDAFSQVQDQQALETLKLSMSGLRPPVLSRPVSA